MHGRSIVELRALRAAALARGDRGLAVEITQYLTSLGVVDVETTEERSPVETAVPRRPGRPRKVV